MKGIYRFVPMARRVTALLSIAVMISASACKGGSAAAADTAATETTTVGTENIAVVISGVLQTGPTVSGNLMPEREAMIRAQVGGSVLQTYADQGQAVRRGQTLARIDAGGLQDVYLSARAGVTAATSSADGASRELGRSEKLLAAGAIAERDIEQARRASANANAALADARARLVTAQKQVGHTVVSSPMSGIVSERPVSAGDVVQSGAAMFTVVDPSSMRLEGSVPSEELTQVKVGAPVPSIVHGGHTLVGSYRFWLKPRW